VLDAQDVVGRLARGDDVLRAAVGDLLRRQCRTSS
jgi:hypothetical protein